MEAGLSVGAIGASLIAGIISLLSLIVSKEQKTSEFRQNWVNELRTEITCYLTSLNAISDALQISYSSHADKVDALTTHYSALNSANFSISLRLNASETRSQSVFKCLDKISRLASNDAMMIPLHIRPIEAELLVSAKDLLKYEWKRVKRGELTFVLAKVSAFLVILVMLFLSLRFIIPTVLGGEVRSQGVADRGFELRKHTVPAVPTQKHGQSVI